MATSSVVGTQYWNKNGTFVSRVPHERTNNRVRKEVSHSVGDIAAMAKKLETENAVAEAHLTDKANGYDRFAYEDLDYTDVSAERLDDISDNCADIQVEDHMLVSDYLSGLSQGEAQAFMFDEAEEFLFDPDRLNELTGESEGAADPDEALEEHQREKRSYEFWDTVRDQYTTTAEWHEHHDDRFGREEFVQHHKPRIEAAVALYEATNEQAQEQVAETCGDEWKDWREMTGAIMPQSFGHSEVMALMRDPDGEAELLDKNGEFGEMRYQISKEVEQHCENLNEMITDYKDENPNWKSDLAEYTARRKEEEALDTPRLAGNR